MRRDYFIDVFLACICASLMFVCFRPLYYTYDAIVPRYFGVLEKCMSLLFSVCVLIAMPVLFALRRRLWATLGLASYGLFAMLPKLLLPGLQSGMSGEDANLLSVAIGLLWKGIYGMVNAPFAALSELLGKENALSLSGWILPTSLIIYVVVQLFRFYRKAYLMEQVDPTSIVGRDAPAAERNSVRTVKRPDVLGTVISKPAVPAVKPQNHDKEQLRSKTDGKE